MNDKKYNKIINGKKAIILIPTYNERENVQKLTEGIMKLGLKLDILFIDDDSPDGTGQILNELSKQYPNVYVLHRPGKLGIGSAHKDGIKWAYDNKYTLLITMDCDFTHPPEYISEAIDNLEGADIVVGSRYILKDSLDGWNFYRKTLTLFGHFVTKYLLKMPYDATGAFRLYHLHRIPEYAFEIVSSKGYSFFFESLYILRLNQFTIKEIPIKLPPRTYGHSKMKLRDALHSFIFLLSIYLTTLFNRKKYEVSEPFIPDKAEIAHLESQQWDIYWGSHKSPAGLIYDAIAAFYRQFIIKKVLGYFIKKHFKQDSEILHAGCGSGQVDTDINDFVSITALDISRNALALYKKANKGSYKLLHGSIFNILLPDNSVNGIYNLGVMEHFTESEIGRILLEFRRVLKPDGKIILFWPPEFGLSVVFLKTVKLIFNHLSRQDVKLHPDEITLIKSKKHVKDIVEGNGFNVVENYFGFRDLFTYMVIVASKKEGGDLN